MKPGLSRPLEGASFPSDSRHMIPDDELPNIYEAAFDKEDLGEYSEASMDVLVYGADGQLVDLNDPEINLPEPVNDRTDAQYFHGLRRPPIENPDNIGEEFSDPEQEGAAWAPELSNALAAVETAGEAAEDDEGTGTAGELTYRASAYEMLHRFRLDWPCLSVDFLRDSGMQARKTFPREVYAIAASQAVEEVRAEEGNCLYVMHISDLSRTRFDESVEMTADAAPDDIDARIDVRRVPVPFATNKVRAAPYGDSIGVVAFWGDADANGRANVYVYDVGDEIASMGNGAAGTDADRRRARGNTRIGNGRGLVTRRSPMCKLPHNAEGWALAWAPTTRVLATGDCSGTIRLFEFTAAPDTGRFGFQLAACIQNAHGRARGRGAEPNSVEDICFAPALSGQNFLASVGCDGCLRLWDVAAVLAAARTSPTHQVSVTEETCTTLPICRGTDLNCLAWEPTVPFRIAAGADDGTVAICELAQAPAPAPPAPAGTTYPRVAKTLTYASAPVTSASFSPYAAGVLASAHESGTTLLWDIDGEVDTEALSRLTPEARAQQETVPGELLFVHRGQEDTKDVVWHPQVVHALITTAADGVHVWSPFQECIDGTNDAE